MTGRLGLAGLMILSTVACGLPRWPVNAPLTSDFGLRVLGTSPSLHRGVDFGVPTGTEVRAMTEPTQPYSATAKAWVDEFLSLGGMS